MPGPQAYIIDKYGKMKGPWHVKCRPDGIRIRKFLTQFDFFLIEIRYR